MIDPVVLVIGTADTKADEILFMKQCIEDQGASAMIMDVGVLGDPSFGVEISKHMVAEAARSTNQGIIDLGDENLAMAKTAEGACELTRTLYEDGKIDAMIALGGTMGTDLALDVASVLPLGVPKVLVSTVAFSPLLPPERMAPDLMMILWAGGLYGLNSICKSSLSQACGAAIGAARAVVKPQKERPVIGITSLGKTSLKYMVHLKPELEKRGFEVAIFHTTGMGGRAMESLAAQSKLACVMDFSLIEVSNHKNGSVVSAGADRLEAAGQAGIPQIVAPGGVTLIDLQAWADVGPEHQGRDFHAHNRLIACVLMEPEEKREVAKTIATKLAKAKGPVKFIMPLGGIDEWDKEGGPFNDPDGLAAFAEEIKNNIKLPVELIELTAHINDKLFAEKALSILDQWIEDGILYVN
ncbi:MAG: Tm-1-like ATP-binding domain-containing protein [Rhodospirillales bacterium]|jgi:uncharacterized protein (UPF0261 family)|nr:Tm-1-like ATP-binding domain-containing protein [Rhodospirillales bacterium]